MGQNRRFEKRCPNGRFLIRKRTLVKDTMNGRSWPISAVPIQSSPMSELGQLRTLATYRCHVCCWGLSGHNQAKSGHRRAGIEEKGHGKATEAEDSQAKAYKAW